MARGTYKTFIERLPVVFNLPPQYYSSSFPVTSFLFSPFRKNHSPMPEHTAHPKVLICSDALSFAILIVLLSSALSNVRSSLIESKLRP